VFSTRADVGKQLSKLHLSFLEDSYPHKSEKRHLQRHQEQGAWRQLQQRYLPVE
jgi:hypothetical protein